MMRLRGSVVVSCVNAFIGFRHRRSRSCLNAARHRFQCGEGDRAAMLPFALLVDLVGSGAFWGPNRLSTAIFATDSKVKGGCRSCSDGAVRWSSFFLGILAHGVERSSDVEAPIVGYSATAVVFPLGWTAL